MGSAVLAFGSLFLGLVRGPNTVELMVGQPITQVEIRLDGREVGTLQQAPWRLEVDLGPELLPHLLEAVGRDETGRRVASVQQRVNLPRPPAEVEVLLRRDSSGAVTGARLKWQMRTWQRPRRIVAELDGAPVQVDPAGEVAWPPASAGSVHLFRVALEFAEGVSASREVAFGADLAEEAGNVLTGMVVRARRGSTPAPAEMGRLIQVRDAPARVVGVEEGPATIVVVADPQAHDAWWQVIWRVASKFRNQDDILVPGEDRVVAVSPAPIIQGTPGSRVNEVFPLTNHERIHADSLLRVFATRPLPLVDATQARLSKAVAVAGVVAAGGNQRRIVLLVLGAAAPASDDLDVASARRFLRALQVPLVVWSPIKTVARAAGNSWGEIADVSSVGNLYKADHALQRELSHQRVVWIEGDHLPQEVSLAATAVDLRLAGESGEE